MKTQKLFIISIGIILILAILSIPVNATEEERKIENGVLDVEDLPSDYDVVNGISIYAENSILQSATEMSGKNELSRVYVVRNGYNYTYSLDKTSSTLRIKRYCFETGEYTRVFDTYGEIDISFIRGNTYIKNNIIYFAYYLNNNNNDLHVSGYDTEQEKIVYDKIFPIEFHAYEAKFCLDNKQNIYFITMGSTEKEVSILSYDKDGNFIDKLTGDFYEVYSNSDITGSNHDDTILFFALQMVSGTTSFWDDYVIKIDNGRFVTQNIYRMRQYAGVIWKFLDETHAYNQYGEFYEMNFNANTDSGVSYKQKKALSQDGNYLYTGYPSTFDDTYVYLGCKKGLMYIFNWHTYEIEGYLSLGENITVTGCFKTVNDNILVEYYDSTTKKYYFLDLTQSDYVKVKKDAEILDHTSLTHTKNQIKKKSIETAIVEKSSNVYEVTPVVTSPYAEGSLKAQVKTDVINQLNYYRWISGLDGVTQNDKYMSYSQRGAVVMAANRRLDHYPVKPANIDSTFYDQGFKATSGRIGKSANISSGSKPAYAIKGYLDDTSNMSPDVGHRLSLLDPKAETISFGYANGYGVVNVFANNSIENADIYYSWPAPGYFPIDAFDVNAMFSITLQSKEYSVSSGMYIVLRANGKEYSSANDDFDVYLDSPYKGYFFETPAEVKTYLTDGTRSIKDGKEVEVELHGLSDNYGNTYVIKYPIKFFSLDNVLAEISLPKTYMIKVGTKNKLTLTGTPASAKIENITWSSSNPSVASISSDGTITANALGETTITAKVDELETSCNLKVANYVIGDVDGDGEVTLVDCTKILLHVRNKKALTSDELGRADIDGDGEITLVDCTKILLHVRGKKLLW